MSQLLSSSPYSPISEIYPLLGRYQQHVHHLEAGIEPQRFIEREETLQPGIPDDLRQFLLIHNGAVLFDGDLCIRSLSALSIADVTHPEVVCFAQMNVMVNPFDMDGVQTEHWAYIIDANGQGCYGLWTPSQPLLGKVGSFTPLYRTFQDWLLSNIRLLVDGTFPSAFRKRHMLVKEPVFFEATFIDQWIEDGNYHQACEVLGRLLEELPTPKAWLQYALCLDVLGKPGVESARLESVRSLHFPLSYVEAVPTDKQWIQTLLTQSPSLRSSMEEIFTALWSDALATIGGPNGRDCFLSRYDLETLTSVAMVLCDVDSTSEISFGDVQQQFVRWNPQFVPARLLIAQIDQLIQQTQHDAAETLIFALLRRDDRFAIECLLRLARIVVARHEPWGLHILFDLLDLEPSASIQTEAWLLASQYCLDNEQYERATEFLGMVDQLHNVDTADSYSGWYWQLSATLAHQEQRFGEAGTRFVKATRLTPLTDIIRLGQIASHEADLYQTMQQHDSANARYEMAMQYFSQVNASLYMAETLLHWGRLSQSQTHFQQAATLFQQVGFASGLSVADRYLSNRRNFWSWYLETTKELTQRWVQYRRAQGRGVRQEADNPERRLYGLKMAVADSPVEIVDLLRNQIYSARTVIERDLVTPAHDQYAYFISGMELLLAHPSIEAHDAVLEFVRSTKMDTVAMDGLIYCLSRTRNQQVITSLCAMFSDQEPTSTHWIVTQVLGERRDTRAQQGILDLLDRSEDTHIQQSCLLALGRLGDSSIIPTLDAYGDIPDLMEHWATALLLLGDDIAIHQLAGQLADGKLGHQSILGHLVGRYGGTTNLLLLRQLAESEQPVAISAIHGLGYLGDTRAIPLLVKMTALRDRNKAIAASHALELMTGHHENTEDYLLRARWQSWLDEHNAWIPNVRYRAGLPMSPAQLIEGLQHDDRLVRSSAYDELVITTGVRLPFDVDGTWRCQQAQVRAWQTWWTEQKPTYPIGCWMLHGEQYC